MTIEIKKSVLYSAETEVLDAVVNFINSRMERLNYPEYDAVALKQLHGCIPYPDMSRILEVANKRNLYIGDTNMKGRGTAYNVCNGDYITFYFPGGKPVGSIVFSADDRKWHVLREPTTEGDD